MAAVSLVMVHSFHAGNGLRVVLAHQPAAPVVAVQAWIGAGSADEPADSPGVAHVLEHMLFKGTTSRGVGQIVREIESAGGHINAWTSLDQTVFHIALGRAHLSTAIEVMADSLINPTLDAGELSRELDVIALEIGQGAAEPSRVLAKQLFAAAFRRHPYARPVIGTEQGVRSLTRDRVESFYRSFYTAPNTTLVVAGDFDSDIARREVERRFGDMVGGRVQRRRAPEPVQRAARAVVAGYPGADAQFALGFHTPTVTDGDTPALDVAAILLGQGESSRLARVARGGALSTSFAYLHTLRDPGLMVVSGRSPADKLADALGQVAGEIWRLTDGASGAELEKARRAAQADAVYASETVQGLARSLATYEQLTGDAEYGERYVERVMRVTSDDVRAAAARYLRADNATLAAMVPESPATRTRESRATYSGRLLAWFGDGGSAKSSPKKPAAQVRSAPVIHKLKNGIQVVVVRDSAVPLVAYRAVWPGGLLSETKRTSGLAGLLAATVTRGCGRFGDAALSERLDAMSATLAGFAGRNTFGIEAEFLAGQWREGMALVADCAVRPQFEAAAVQRDKRAALDTITAAGTSPAAVAFHLMSANLYRSHPYRLPLHGDTHVVSALDERSLSRHYRAMYPASAMTLAIVGDVDPQRAIEEAERLLGGQPAVKPVPLTPAKENYSGRSADSREIYHDVSDGPSADQMQLVIGYPGATVDDSDRFALEVMTAILGGQGGRLFARLRDRDALVYRVGMTALDGVGAGYLAAYLSCDPSKLPAAIAALRQELASVAKSGVTAAEVTRAVTALSGAHAISLQRRSALAAALSFNVAFGLGTGEITDYDAFLRKVSAADVQRAARRFLDPSRAVTVTVGPLGKSPEASRRARGVVKRRPPRRGKRRP